MTDCCWKLRAHKGKIHHILWHLEMKIKWKSNKNGKCDEILSAHWEYFSPEWNGQKPEIIFLFTKLVFFAKHISSPKTKRSNFLLHQFIFSSSGSRCYGIVNTLYMFCAYILGKFTILLKLLKKNRGVLTEFFMDAQTKKTHYNIKFRSSSMRFKVKHGEETIYELSVR